MVSRSLAIWALGALSCACSTSRSARTYADVEAAVTRMRAEWERSQLTDRPLQDLITRDLRFHLFFQLPMAERAILVMERFANVEFDGEVGFMMAQMLRYRTEPGGKGATIDPTYTAELFRIIESYSEPRVRRFCSYEAERYARFRRNLRHWKAYFSSGPNHAMERTAARCASTLSMTKPIPLRVTFRSRRPSLV